MNFMAWGWQQSRRVGGEESFLHLQGENRRALPTRKPTKVSLIFARRLLATSHPDPSGDLAPAGADEQEPNRTGMAPLADDRGIHPHNEERPEDLPSEGFEAFGRPRVDSLNSESKLPGHRPIIREVEPRSRAQIGWVPIPELEPGRNACAKTPRAKGEALELGKARHTAN